MTARRAGFPARRRQVRAPPVLPALAHKAGSAALRGASSSRAGAGWDVGRLPGDSGSLGKGTASQQGTTSRHPSHDHTRPRPLFQGWDRPGCEFSIPRFSLHIGEGTSPRSLAELQHRQLYSAREHFPCTSLVRMSRSKAVGWWWCAASSRIYPQI